MKIVSVQVVAKTIVTVTLPDTATAEQATAAIGETLSEMLAEQSAVSFFDDPRFADPPASGTLRAALSAGDPPAKDAVTFRILHPDEFRELVAQGHPVSVGFIGVSW